MIAIWQPTQEIFERPEPLTAGDRLIPGAAIMRPFPAAVAEDLVTEPPSPPPPAPVQPEPVPLRPAARNAFPSLLRSYRERAGRSRNNLAHEVGVDPSYLTRIEHGDRETPRLHIVEALCRSLHLTIAERNGLLVAGGYAPLSVIQLGSWDDALQAVADVLTDVQLTPEQRDEFRTMVMLVARNWRGRGSVGVAR